MLVFLLVTVLLLVACWRRRQMDGQLASQCRPARGVGHIMTVQCSVLLQYSLCYVRCLVGRAFVVVFSRWICRHVVIILLTVNVVRCWFNLLWLSVRLSVCHSQRLLKRLKGLSWFLEQKLLSASDISGLRCASV